MSGLRDSLRALSQKVDGAIPMNFIITHSPAIEAHTRRLVDYFAERSLLSANPRLLLNSSCFAVSFDFQQLNISTCLTRLSEQSPESGKALNAWKVLFLVI